MACYYSTMRDFEMIERQLAAANVLLSPAEAQGLLCGLLCLPKHDVRQQWAEELLEADIKAAESAGGLHGSLAGLYADTVASLKDAGFGFTLLLPDDKGPIAERAQAVCDWCQGFLYGFGLTGVNLEKELPDLAREALKDLTEVTRMDVDSVDDDDEHEDALVELEEFVKVAVLLVYEELSSKREECLYSS